MNNLYIYLDESGDLGFSPGSTDYFTISFIILNNPVLFKRAIRKTKVVFDIPKKVELKGSGTRFEIKRSLLLKIAKLSDLEIYAITVNKENVAAKLKHDTNILYNYIVGLSLIERILKEPSNSSLTIIIDRRIVSISSGFNLDKYIKYKIWYEGKRKDLNLNIHYVDSHTALGLQGIDVICNSIFRKYNTNDTRMYNIIKRKIATDRKLFFHKKKEVAPISD